MENNIVMSYHKMRRWVGYLGVSLPFSLWIGDYFFHKLKISSNESLMKMCTPKYNSNEYLRSSISEYYYTPMGELFVGTLCAVAFFLFCYKGYPKKQGELLPSDSFMTNLAGICALLVVIFPMSFKNCVELSDNFKTFVSNKPIGTIHYISAIVFFISLGIISLVNFRRTSTVEKFGAMPSHNFYKWCGIGIFISLLSIPLFKFIDILENWAHTNGFPYLYVFETTALLFFGASWIKKGQIASD